MEESLERQVWHDGCAEDIRDLLTSPFTEKRSGRNEDSLSSNYFRVLLSSADHLKRHKEKMKKGPPFFLLRSLYKPLFVMVLDRNLKL